VYNRIGLSTQNRQRPAIKAQAERELPTHNATSTTGKNYSRIREVGLERHARQTRETTAETVPRAHDGVPRVRVELRSDERDDLEL
jgi:hypothetical protein